MSRLSDEAIEKRMAELRDLGDSFAKAHAQKNYLEEFRKTKLAMLMKDALVAGEKTTTGQEREARCDAAYDEVLRGLRDATEIAEKARWQLEIAKLNISVWQTKESSRRAELHALKG